MSAAIIEGGDGYSSHADCKPRDATSVTVRAAADDPDLCWICADPLDDTIPAPPVAALTATA